MMSFGPVPSRRLGRSIGINNIPPKICSYSCVYCQLGRTDHMRASRTAFYEPEELTSDVAARLDGARAAGENVDYLTFVPDGEPTLDINLGREIELLRELGVPIAVISNASLIWMTGVRRELALANWVSLKVDAVSPGIWHHMNRPHGALDHDRILDGIADFAAGYQGKLVTETMLVRGVNDDAGEIEKLADFALSLGPDTCYISVPTRPPAETWVSIPSGGAVNRAYQIFSGLGLDAELLTGYEGDAFSSTGSPEDDLLGIISVHPMREDALAEYLARTGGTWETAERLIREGRMIELEYTGRRFYLRNLSDRQRE